VPDGAGDTVDEDDSYYMHNDRTLLCFRGKVNYQMRYRKLTASGDMQFGHSLADFWYNQIEGVAQAIRTRLLLYAGEWFLDTSEGTPWGGFPLNDLVVSQGQILGANTAATRDLALRQRILGTEGVRSLLEYSSSFDPDSRMFSVNAVVDTIYGAVSVAGRTLSGVFALDVTPLDSDTGLG
jgi:hypothetical protein